MSVRREPGYTLTELVVVITILALVAAVAIPNLSTRDESALDIAAGEVASAIRFAHSEAIRTGEPHGVYASQPSQRIRIYRLPVSTPIYDIYDPLTKQLYDFDFSTDPTGVDITSVYLTFDGMWDTKNYLGFSGGAGTPKYNDSGTVRMLQIGRIELSYRDAERTIEISPMTGRVMVR